MASIHMPMQVFIDEKNRGHQGPIVDQTPFVHMAPTQNISLLPLI